jgi:hypothetical protein
MSQNIEMLNDIKQVLDISSRVDERVKIIQTGQQELNARLNHFIDELNILTGRVLVLESKNGNLVHQLEDEVGELGVRLERMDIGAEVSKETLVYLKNKDSQLNNRVEDISVQVSDITHRLSVLEGHNEGWHTKAKHYGNLLVQALWVIAVCYILFRLGISTPPIP